MFEVEVELHGACEDGGVVVQVLFFPHFALWAEAAGRDEDGVDEEHGEGIEVAGVAEHYADEGGFVAPEFAELVVDLFRGYVFLAEAAHLFLDGGVGSGLAFREGVSRFLALSYLFIFLIALSIYQEDLVGAFLFDSFALSFAIHIGALLLGESV